MKWNMEVINDKGFPQIEYLFGEVYTKWNTRGQSALLPVICVNFAPVQDTSAHFSMIECPSLQRSMS